MAAALIAGLRASGVAAELLRASEPRAERRSLLAREHGIEVGADNAEIAGWAEVLVLAVKPQVMEQALASIAPKLAEGTLVISILAGVPTARLQAGLPAGARVVRAMPNTPALVGAGATALCKGSAATDADLAAARELFEAGGRVVVVSEAQMDAVTGLSGSGPAYVMTVIEALADGGVKAGLARDVALELATHTVLGSARLLAETGQHPGALRDAVTSPGGTTIHGLAALERGGLRSALIEAVSAAAARSRELGG